MPNIENIYSLTPLQQGLLSHGIYEPESRVYYQQMSLRLTGALERPAFRAAWQELLACHAVLRTGFLWEDTDEAYQVVHTELPLPLVELDWRGQEGIEAALRQRERDERNAAFDLSEPPLMRLCLIRLTEAEWQLIWTHHHLILDGWSVGLVLGDWLTLYQTYRGHGAGQRPPIRRPYQDYVAWLTKQDLSQAQAFWRNQLADFTEPTPLPITAGLPSAADLPYAEQHRALSPEQTQTLIQFARERQLTLNTLVQGAWALLLGRYAGRDEVVFGVTLAGRPAALAGADEMVGLFINTLPLRARWDERTILADWLRGLQDRNSELRQYEHTPLAKLKGLSGVPGDRSLFDAILVFENFPLDASLSNPPAGLTLSMSESSATLGDVRLSQGRNSFPLSLIVEPTEGLELTLVYARDRFTDATIRRLLGHLQALLLALPTQAERPVEAVNWLDAPQRQQVLTWGQGESLMAPASCLHPLIERHAETTPDRLAVVDRQQSLSYRQLEVRANQLAHRLRALDMAVDQPVAVALERCADFVVAVLAILKAGGCYLPLDLKQPPARLASLITDSGTRIVIARRGQPARLGEHAATTVWLDDTAPAESNERPQVKALRPAAAAYIIYTSGSTGTPKGVVIEHRAIVDYIRGLLHTLALPADCRFAMASTVAADLGHTQLFGALCGGGTLYLIDEERSFDPAAFADFMHAQRIDVLKLTPSHLRGLLAARPDADLLPAQTLILGGEALPAELVRQVRALKPDLRLFNHYGPTEASVGAIVGIVPRDSATGESVSLGHPLPNRRLYVLDPQGAPVPVGVPGELYIGGPALARGYLNRPQLTAAAFVPDCFAGGRMYRTGDRVRWRDDGELEFLGRVDNQVKLRGYRIELGEVEAQVRQLAPQIRQVLARIVQLPEQPPRLVAYVIADGALNVELLRNDLSRRVPDYLVPAAFISLDAIPLNANGKPDLKRLPLPEAPGSNRSNYVAPRNEIEAILAKVWQSVLHVEPIGVHDNFFALGGDSILNLQIIARTNQRGLKLTPKQLFENRTIAEIAAVVAASAPAAADREHQPRTIIPLTAGQHDRIAHNALYATWRCVRLATAVDAETLQQALQAVQRHHRALRMGLQRLPSGEWQQFEVTQPKPAVLSRHTVDEADPAVLARLADDCLTELDLAAGQGWHGGLLEGGADRQLLLVSHSLLLDEASWPLLLRDLALALAQIHWRRPLQLSPLGGDLADWACQQRQYAASEALEPAWEYWLQLAGQEFASLPVAADAEPSIRSVELTGAETERLRHLQRRTHVCWEALLATAIAEEMARDESCDQLLIDIDSGRPDSARLAQDAPLALTGLEASEIAGRLQHPTPVALAWPAHADRLERLRQIDAQLAALPNGGADYGVLRYLSDNVYLREPLLSLPGAQISLALLGDWDGHRERHGLLQEITAASMLASTDHALRVEAFFSGGHLRLICYGRLATQWSARLHARLAELARLADAAPAAVAPHAFPLCAPACPDLASLALDWEQIQDLYPLSPMQQGMLLHTRMLPHSGIYLMQQRYRWDGELDRDALKWAWQQLLARHAVLRTGFWWQDDQAPLQCVYRATDSAFAWYDLRHLEHAAQQQHIDAVLAGERYQGYDMRRAPLTGLRVFHIAEHRYLLARSFHHILTDAWCFGLLIQDLLAHYSAYTLGQPVAQPRARPFRDYIRWLHRQDLDAAQVFWKQELASFTAPTPLVVDTGAVAPGSAAAEVAEADITLTVAQTRSLQQLCQQYELTPNTWVQGAWAVLLSRYSGNRDVLFGVTVAGRPAELSDVENIVGLFINSLPLRVQVDEEQSVRPWLQNLLARNVELRAFEHAPLVDIQRWSEIERGRSLFDSLVVFENAPFDTALAAETLNFRIDIYEDRVHTNYPITVVIYPEDRLGIRISYDKRRFAPETIERMLNHLQHLLGQMVNAPDAPLRSLELLTPAERQLVLEEWNRTEQPFPLERSYAELFAERVAQHPDRVAAVCDGETLTYGELDRRAARLAHALITAGAKPDTPVALLAERGLALLTMMIAAFKAGAAYLPLDVNHPPQRLRTILRLSAAPLVLASERTTALLDQMLSDGKPRPQVLIAESIWLQQEPAAELAPAGRPEHLAYVIFTSGSTGTPKGVLIEQRGMLNNIFAKVPALGLSETDRIAQTASPAFDVSVWQFLAAPVLGATVHILPDAIAHDPARLLDAVEAQGLTILEAVPAVLRGMLDACPRQTALRSLRWVLPTGEALPPALCRDWFARFASIPLMNAYGPAECADDVAFHPITAAPAEDALTIPIGRPTANAQLFILDEQLRPVPIGVPGEICVGGIGVGRGYLNDSERTAKAFLPHPFQPDARFYRTGDIGRYQPEGVIEYLGRKDHQVKIRGQRLELGEIESRLTRHPAVNAAAVLALPNERGDLRLIAYWQAKLRTQVDATLLQDYLAAELPAYMVPSAFVHLDELVLNANGKLDRKALAARPLDVTAMASAAYSAPRNELEAELAAIWAEILGLAQVGVEDNFFALGGHSLLATQVIGRLRRQYQVELPLKTLFDHSTVAALAPVVAAARVRPPALLPALTPQPRTEKLPLSFAQQRLWFLELLHPGSTRFNLPFALRLRGALNESALEQSFAALITRHEILRTGFASEAGTPYQRIHVVAPFRLARTDLRADPEPLRQSRLQQILHSLHGQPFDLDQPPLLRAHLLQLAEQEHVLAVTFHHIVVDAWSIGLLVKELTAAYAAYLHDQSPDWQPLPLQYADFALWQRQHLSGPLWQQQMTYWRQQLAGAAPVLLLPEAQLEPEASRQGAGGRHLQALPRTLQETLLALAEAQESTLFMVLHATLAMLLHHQTGRTDLLIGADIANRHRQETEGMVGFFVNQLVLRCRLAREQSFEQLLAVCRDTALAAYQHQDLPFDALVAELLPQRDGRYSPFFQTKLVLQNGLEAELALPGLEVEELALAPPEAEIELLLNVALTAEGLQVVYDYDTALYSEATIARLSELYQILLQAVAQAPSRTVAELTGLLDQAHQQRLDSGRHHRDQQRAALGRTRRKSVVH